MITGIIFGICTIYALSIVNKKYKWYENLELTIRAYKNFFLIQIYYWIMLGTLIILKTIIEVLGKNRVAEIQIELGLMMLTFITTITIYIIYKMFSKDKRIEEIKENHKFNEYMKNLWFSVISFLNGL